MTSKSEIASERMCPDVPAPRAYVLPSSKVWKDGKPNHDAIREHFFHEGRLSGEDMGKIISLASKILGQEDTMLRLDTPITVVGDIHGQFYDLVRMFEIGGHVSKTRYVFLGDYVDRGCFSIEVVVYLYALKICYPEQIYMLRGNHECRHLTQYFNFKIEVKHKFDLDMYKKFMASFDCLPLAALLNGKFLCVHGGLSPDIKRLSDISKIDRFREPPTSGPMCDILWADPCEEIPENMDVKFIPNATRGCSYFYGYAGVCKFLEDNDLLSVIRAHEAEDEGYRMYRKRDSTAFPSVITLFSASNYLDVYNNKGAILKFDDNVLNIQQYSSSPHPYWLPNFMNVLTWSLPFVAEKLTEMLLAILNVTADDDDDDDFDEEDEAYLAAIGGAIEEQERGSAAASSSAAGSSGSAAASAAAPKVKAEAKSALSAERKSQIKRKILSVSRMSRMFSTLRQERETILALKGLAPGNKIPQGLLQEGSSAIREALSSFEEARKADRVNEHLPPPIDSED